LSAFAFRSIAAMAVQSSLPGLTLLKPLKGCDAETKNCLRSWFLQSYPGPVQILLGVASAEDPVCALARARCWRNSPQVRRPR
jgi:hypothetical protein